MVLWLCGSVGRGHPHPSALVLVCSCARGLSCSWALVLVCSRACGSVALWLCGSVAGGVVWVGWVAAKCDFSVHGPSQVAPTPNLPLPFSF